MIHVRKHPDPFTLAIRTPAVGDPPPGYELMTEGEFDAWRDDELAAGWTPAPLPTPDTPPDMIALLGEAFRALIPEEHRGALATVFATVRVLVQAGEIELAREAIAATAVPPELESAKAQFLAFFDAS